MSYPQSFLRRATICLMVLVVANASPAFGQLEGCRNPAVISTALSHLVQLDWANLSAEEVQKIWPVELRGLDCDSQRCTSIESKERIIDGHYECSEIFFFGPPDEQPEAPLSRLHLQSAVIHFTTASKQQTLTAAKTLAKAAGLSELDLQKLADDHAVQFLWEYDKSRMTGMTVDFANRGNSWTVTLHISRYNK